MVTRVLLRVLKKPPFLALAGGVAVFILFIAIWLPNLSFLSHTILTPLYSLSDRVNILTTSVGTLQTNFTILSRWLTVAVAILTGTNFSLFVFYVKERRKLEKSSSTGVLGTLIGLLGVGCTACGSVILTSIFGFGASAVFIGFFPLRGAEFGILGVIVLLFANYLIIKKIDAPLVCKPLS
jgi:uncharacterized membrane protein